MDLVRLDLEVHAIVGILPRERVEPQPLRIAVEMALDLQPCAETGDLSRSVDYGEVDAQLRFLAIHGRFLLVESLALACCRAILLPPGPTEPRAQVAGVSVTIRKPVVLRAAEPGVMLVRDPAVLAGELLIDVPGEAGHRLRAWRAHGPRPVADHLHRIRDDLWLAMDTTAPARPSPS